MLIDRVKALHNWQEIRVYCEVWTFLPNEGTEGNVQLLTFSLKSFPIPACLPLTSMAGSFSTLTPSRESLPESSGSSPTIEWTSDWGVGGSTDEQSWLLWFHCATFETRVPWGHLASFSFSFNVTANNFQGMIEVNLAIFSYVNCLAQ